MDIVVHQKNLQKALGRIERATAKNAALPILHNILLKTENGRLTLSATNLEVGITAMIGAKITKEGQIAVPGRIIADLARATKAETVALSVKQNVLSVASGSYRTSVLCFDASEYPIIPRVEGVPFSIDVQQLNGVLGSIVDSVASSDARPELAGALFHFQKEKLTAAATDSFRLVERVISAHNNHEATLIIPRSTITELLHVLGDASGDIEVRMTDNQIAFTHPEFEVVSRLIDGRYPDYRKVIPERFLSKALMRKDDLVHTIKVAALFSSSIADIKISCSEGILQASAKNSGKGEGEASNEANLKGEPFEIAINHHYLLDGLKIIPGDTVIIEFTGKGSPLVLRPGDSQTGFVYLVMPLRG
jgi:DNA polymerase III subunit beta